MSAQPAERVAASARGSLASLLPDTQNLAWRSDSTSFAQRMLAKMGWREGRGLGKREDGVVAHVRVKRRLDAAGVGAELARAPGVNGGRNGNEVLLAAVGEYGALLAGMGALSAPGARGAGAAAAAAAGAAAVAAGAAAAGADDAGDGGGEGGDEDVEAAAARKAERKAARKRERKRLREEGAAAEEDGAAEPGEQQQREEEVEAPRPGAGAAAATAAATAAAPSPQRSTAHVPAGRHKVLKQKDVRRYSAADMAAILGQAPR